jgi:hypothetical protein
MTWNLFVAKSPIKISAMFSSLRHLIGWIVSALGSRKDLILENLALRQQPLSLHAKLPRRRVSAMHKLFWVFLRRLWSGWKTPLILVTPRTVVEWHRAGFRLYWKWLSRTRQLGGRKPVSKEVRALIFRMAAENPTWGAPRIHGELLKLGFNLSEPTVSRWLRRAPRDREWASVGCSASSESGDLDLHTADADTNSPSHLTRGDRRGKLGSTCVCRGGGERGIRLAPYQKYLYHWENRLLAGKPRTARLNSDGAILPVSMAKQKP